MPFPAADGVFVAIEEDLSVGIFFLEIFYYLLHLLEADSILSRSDPYVYFLYHLDLPISLGMIYLSDETGKIVIKHMKMVSRMDPLEILVHRLVRVTSSEELQSVKFQVCGEFGLEEVPGNAELIAAARRVLHGDELSAVLKLLKRKPSRSQSGVAVVAVMTSPEGCPHGKCIVCPGGPDSDFYSPQSYTGREPAALRGIRHDYSPYEQVSGRLEQYHAIGHHTDKVDLIIMGGTFPARDLGYQRDFVKGCLDALNGLESSSLEDSIRENETAPNRCIGLTVETRPDHCGPEELDNMLSYGTTRVELGVQSVNDKILVKMGRGHGVRETVEATERCKDRGLKVCYHIMPGLPGSSPEEDLRGFREIFSDQRFMPDMIKIYPTLVVEGTELHRMWKRGEYEPLSTPEAAELIARMKALIPPYVRIQRVQRDIPSPIIEAGVVNSNLRQYVWDEMEKKGLVCRCLRCREAGRALPVPEDVDLIHREYSASGGVEHFFELGDGETMVAYARLRMKDGIPPTIRELRVVGHMTPLDTSSIHLQHSGYGNRLLEVCEEFASGVIRVTSGIGVREYYRQRGYELRGPYMVKNLP